MKFLTEPHDEGFMFCLEEGNHRTRFVTWQASGGSETASGQFDLAMMEVRQEVNIPLGWRPEKIIVQPLRDPTPGAHQQFELPIPLGASRFYFTPRRDFKTQIHVQASISGHPGDTRFVGVINGGQMGKEVSIPIKMNQPWKRLFLKKNALSEEKIEMSGFGVTHLPSAQEYESIAHLIKPESEHIRREGRSGVIFTEKAPIYSYVALRFQRR